MACPMPSGEGQPVSLRDPLPPHHGGTICGDVWFTLDPEPPRTIRRQAKAHARTTHHLARFRLLLRKYVDPSWAGLQPHRVTEQVRTVVGQLDPQRAAPPARSLREPVVGPGRPTSAGHVASPDPLARPDPPRPGGPAPTRTASR